MKLAIFSDLHLGFKEGNEREQECFENARSAFEIACREQTDAILIAGDIFDVPLPSPETMLKAFEIFSIPQKQSKPELKISVVGEKTEKKVNFNGLPVIAIHGTHDYRSIGQTNVLELFDASGYLVYLKMKKAVIEKNGETVCVHGFSGVPEKKSLDVLRLWNPKPVNGAVNILMMHQSIMEFLPFSDEMIATISLSNLPQGFDLIVNGHLHWSNIQKLEGSTFLLTGSTVTTQMKKLEAEKPKGVFVFDHEKKSLDFFELPMQRKLFYFKEKFSSATSGEVLERARTLASQAVSDSSGLPPMVRLKLVGNLADGFSSLDIDFKELKKEFEGRAILSISKEFFSASFKKKISELRGLHASKQSIASIGLELLEKNLEKTSFDKSFDVREMFELLSENKIDEAISLVQKPKKD